MKLINPAVSVAWLHAHLDASNLVILNASNSKIAEKHHLKTIGKTIPQSRFFDLTAKFSDVSTIFPNTFPSVEQFTKEAQTLGINKDSAIVVYDDKGIYSSARAWWLFKAFGHNNVSVLNGGLPQWLYSRFPTELYHPYQGKKGDFVGNYMPELMKFFNDVKFASQDKSHIIIDARSEKRFKGLVPEPREGLRQGTIPNSVNLPFEDLLDGGCLKNVDELKQLFRKLARPCDKIILSCGSGMTACVLALGGEIAGYYKLSVYDGSWTEWGTLDPLNDY